MSFRPARPDDPSRILEIHNACWPEHFRDLERLLRYDQIFPTLRFVGERGGSVVAHASIRDHGNRYELEVAVLPEHRGQGIGSGFYLFLLEQLPALPPKPLQAFTKEAHLPFAERRGWREAMRSYHQYLELPRFDPAPFAGLLNGLEAQGYSFRAFDQLTEPDREARLHALVNATEVDIPATTPVEPVDLEGFRLKYTHGPNFLPEGSFVAVHDGLYAGLTFTRRRSPTSLHTGMTGVLSAHRGQGLAMALKARVAAYAKAAGMLELHTNNAATNLGILAVNERLGFVREPAQIELHKEFG